MSITTPKRLRGNPSTTFFAHLWLQENPSTYLDFKNSNFGSPIPSLVIKDITIGTKDNQRNKQLCVFTDYCVTRHYPFNSVTAQNLRFKTIFHSTAIKEKILVLIFFPIQCLCLMYCQEAYYSYVYSLLHSRKMLSIMIFSIYSQHQLYTFIYCVPRNLQDYLFNRGF